MPLLIAAPAAPAAHATFHEISIREVYPGSVAQPQSGYVELQMYEGGQHFVGGHGVTIYNSTGGAIGTFAFGSALAGPSAGQQTILVGDSGVAAAFGVTPDLVDANFNLPASGAACWAESIDCVAWGSFSDTAPPLVGTPVDGAGIPDGMAIRRSISKGSCTNLLDFSDDTNDSAADFTDAAPAPVSYATKPSATACTPPPPAPTALIDTKPAGATSDTSAAFSFHSEPAGAEFECKLDAGGFADCDSGSISYVGPLAEATHTFQVRAMNANGTGAATSYSWKVDLTAPTAAITSHPADPSPGAGASFKYSSNESSSKFECRLTPSEASFSACDTQPKTYLELTDGDYEFEVRAIDPAGNTQGTPASFAWTVDNSLADTMPLGAIPRVAPALPPQTTIGTKPAARTGDRTPTFRFRSATRGAAFQCKIDGAAFKPCRSPFTTKTLPFGRHTVKIRAVAGGLADPSPAICAFKVVKRR